jgi:transcription antitermination factor NusG
MGANHRRGLTLRTIAMVAPMHFGRLAPEVERWAALRTAARWEKKIAGDLIDAGVPVFLPLVSRLTKYANKTQTSELPMFGGYVFCSEQHFTGNERVPRATRQQVAQILRPPDYAILKTELEEIAAVTTNHRLVQERVYGQVGDRVVIMAGAMTGTEGIILQLKPNQRRLRLEVTFLGALLDVELDETLVVKA